MADDVRLNLGTTGDLIGADDIAGTKFQRVKLIHGADGSNAGDVATTNPFPTNIYYKNRVEVFYSGTGSAAGTTGTETLIGVVKSSGTGAPGAAVGSQAPSSGKIFKITSITFGSRGNATATAQVTTFTLRINPTGTTTATSNAKLSARTATPATALAWDRVSIPLPDAGYEILGDGTLTFGVSANAVYATNAPTWDVLITGFEYTP